MTTTTKDYFGEGLEPLICSDCSRPIYYDYEDEGYHHAINAGVGCFLIGPDSRPDDIFHPLYGVEPGDGLGLTPKERREALDALNVALNYLEEARTYSPRVLRLLEGLYWELKRVIKEP